MGEKYVSETLTVSRKNLTEIINLVEELVINKVSIEKIKNGDTEISYNKVLDQELRIVSEIQSNVKNIGLARLETIKDSLGNLVKKEAEARQMKVDFVFEGLKTEIEASQLDHIHNIVAGFIKDLFDNEPSHDLDQIKVIAYSDDKVFSIGVERSGRDKTSTAVSTIAKADTLELTVLDEEKAVETLTENNCNHVLNDLIELREDLEYSGGSIKIVAEAEQLMRLDIEIPVASSIMTGMLIQCGDQAYAIPTDFIETIMNSKNVKQQQAFHQNMILYLDRAIPVENIAERLNIESSGALSAIVIVRVKDEMLALLVDSVIDQVDMVVKAKPPTIKEVKAFRGTTVLGDGKVTLVLDVPALIKNA
ncbi:chemotaxis protein CheW [Fusibacter sp. 3D3]|uniref:chemotaxis protein CheW n=1 Tax=Fusibacter sp. 3D3 TaxID=1048380 RepID=UPI00085330FB|nr:chemotaxis protein CheW [Fusibacter sp. 3D3]GAU76297.1 signal transduction histidine kinase CheA [Fusibacter sp. 3D3]